MSLVRKVAIVTGGASGFGASVARKLAAKGAIVAVLDRDEEGGKKVVAELVDKYSGELDIEHFIFVKVDLSDLKDLKRAFDTVVNKYGTLDIMINNAGLGTGDLAFDASLTGTESDPAPWSLMHSVNTTAVFYGTQLAITEFSSANGGKGKKGVIVCTASMAAFNTDDGNLAIYGSGKAAIVYFVRKVQSLLKSRNSQIRINAVCPAGAATAMLKQGAEIPEWKEMFGKIMKRFQVPVDSVADAMMLCVEQEELKGEALRVVPQGIETWDFAGNKRKALLAKI